jgi:hypothetical protein
VKDIPVLNYTAQNVITAVAGDVCEHLTWMTKKCEHVAIQSDESGVLSTTEQFVAFIRHISERSMGKN